MPLSIILALTREGVIGKNNSLPWHLPNDLKRFKQLTKGHPIIMGRKTHESIGRPLPERRNLIVSRQKLSFTNCEVFSSLDAALKSCDPREEVFVIGGAELFKSAFPLANKLYLTWIEKPFDGDVVLGELDLSSFQKVFEEKHTEPFDYTFVSYERL